MFNLGLGEIVLIAIVLLVIVGPDKLPETLRKIAQFITRFRRAMDNVREEFHEVYQDTVEETRKTIEGGAVKSHGTDAADSEDKPDDEYKDEPGKEDEYPAAWEEDETLEEDSPGTDPQPPDKPAG